MDEIFGSGDEDNNTINLGYNLLGTQVIGSTGGEINLDSIIVSVPSGTFDENNEISIYVGEENDGFDEYGISALYQISGLPSTIYKPIRLSIKYHGTLEGDTLVAIGTMQYATSLDSSLYSYHTDSASDSSGYLVYDLPAYSSLAKLAHPEDGILSTLINIMGLGKYTMSFSSGSHFLLCYPIFYKAQGILMGEAFEKDYDKCLAMGFSLSGRDFLINKATVLAKPLKPGLGGFYTHSGHPSMTDQHLKSWIIDGKFTINLGILSDNLKLTTTCGHEFLHLIQNLYEFSAPWIEPEQNWIMEATSVWIEEKYANVPNYVSSTLNYREMYPFDGWQYAGNGYAEQGYGLTVIIKDIAERYGDDAIVKIFEKIKAGILPSNAVDPVDAVFSILTEPVGNFWHGVLGAYVLGHYYNNQVNFRFLDDPNRYSSWNKVVYSGTDTIDPMNNKIIFKKNYHDLSGKLFKVLPGDFSTLSTVPLSFTVDDPTNCGILVCKYKKGSEITKIGEVFPGGSGEVILSDVKPVFDAGYELVVLVSNSSHNKSKNYQETKDIELIIELLGDILNGKVEFFLDKAVTNRSSSRGIEEILHFNDLNGIFSNNHYKGSYWYQSLGRTFSGTVEITFIDNPESINFHLNGKYTYQSLFGFGTVTFRYTVDYDGIPYKGLEGEYVKYHVYSENGSTVQNGQFTWSETNSQWTENLISYSCGDGAYIRVEVDKRE